MKIIGFRNSTTSLRYALLEWDGKNATFLNRTDEHCLKYPKEISSIPAKLKWLSDEIDRIIRKNKDIEYVGVKVSEYGRAEKKATRFTSYADAIIFLVCEKNNIPTQEYIYSQLPTTSKDVKGYAEKIAGETDKYWDAQIADAISVAYAVKREAK